MGLEAALEDGEEGPRRYHEAKSDDESDQADDDRDTDDDRDDDRDEDPGRGTRRYPSSSSSSSSSAAAAAAAAEAQFRRDVAQARAQQARARRRAEDGRRRARDGPVSDDDSDSDSGRDSGRDDSGRDDDDDDDGHRRARGGGAAVEKEAEEEADEADEALEADERDLPLEVPPRDIEARARRHLQNLLAADRDVLRRLDSLRAPPDNSEDRWTEVQCLRCLDALYARILGDHPLRYRQWTAHFARLHLGFGARESLKMDAIAKAAALLKLQATRLAKVLGMRGLLQQNRMSLEFRDFSIDQQLRDILARVATEQELLEAEVRAQMAASSDGGAVDDADLLRRFSFMPHDTSQLKEYQRFLVFILDKLSKAGYRRYRGACYEQIMSPPIGGIEYPTHAWRRVCTFEEFIHEVTDKTVHADMWAIMTVPHTVRNVATHLKSCKDDQFVQLTPSREWFAFSNGLLNVRKLQFFFFGDPSNKIPADVVACRYFEREFRYDLTFGLANWMDVPTSVDKILDRQLAGVTVSPTVAEMAMAPEARKVSMDRRLAREKLKIKMWIFAFFGRMLFPTNSLDKWQVFMYLKGRGGTGKSSIGMLLMHIYNAEDVATIPNRVDEKFWLAPLHEALVAIGLDVKGDSNIPQAEFQSMVSGEAVTLRKMNEPPFTAIFSTPVMIIANENPPWRNNSKSITRRTVMLPFDYTVPNNEKDPRLYAELMDQMDLFLFKSAMAYLSAVAKYGDKDLWSVEKKELPDGTRHMTYVLPEFFHRASQQLEESSHVLSSFLSSTTALAFDSNANPLTFDPSTAEEDKQVCMPFDIFKRLASEWIMKNMPKSSYSWKPEFYASAMETRGLRVFRLPHNVKWSYMGTRYEGDWVYGCTEKHVWDELLQRAVDGDPKAQALIGMDMKDLLAEFGTTDAGSGAGPIVGPPVAMGSSVSVAGRSSGGGGRHEGSVLSAAAAGGGGSGGGGGGGGGGSRPSEVLDDHDVEALEALRRHRAARSSSSSSSSAASVAMIEMADAEFVADLDAEGPKRRSSGDHASVASHSHSHSHSRRSVRARTHE